MSEQPVRRVSRFIRNHPWAITEEKLDAICEVIDARMRGVTLSEQEIQARVGALAQGRDVSVVNAVAVIPCYGVLSQKMNMMTAISGGTSMEQFVGQVKQAVDDQGIRAVVIDANSPGGVVDGLIEASDALFALRGKKPIVAVANPCIASAAYWLLSQCDEVIGSPSAQVGSIGVFCVHDDESVANEKAGYKPTYIYAGEYKVEGNPDQPLGDEARAYKQKQVDVRYAQFLQAIVRGRKLSLSAVKNNFGKGRVLFAEDAKAVKMIDSIATLNDTVARFMGSSGGQMRMRGSVSSAPVAYRSEPIEIPIVAAADVPADEPVDTMDPVEGECEDGYELGDDGLCHLIVSDDDEEEAKAEVAKVQAAADDAIAIAAVLGTER